MFQRPKTKTAINYTIKATEREPFRKLECYLSLYLNHLIKFSPYLTVKVYLSLHILELRVLKGQTFQIYLP